METVPPPAKTMNGIEGAKHPLDPKHLCEALGDMNNSLEHLEKGYSDCFHETVKATREVLADINKIDATYIGHCPYGDWEMAEGCNPCD